MIFFGEKIQYQFSEPKIGESLDTKTVCCRAGEVPHHHRRPCRNMDSSDRDDAVTGAGTGDPFQQPRQALGLLGFSGAGLNSTGTGPRIADGWYTSDAGGVAAQTRTGTKRPAADPPRPAGDGLPGELGVDAGYGPSGTSSYGESPSPTDVDWSSRCDFSKSQT